MGPIAIQASRARSCRDGITSLNRFVSAVLKESIAYVWQELYLFQNKLMFCRAAIYNFI